MCALMAAIRKLIIYCNAITRDGLAALGTATAAMTSSEEQQPEGPDSLQSHQVGLGFVRQARKNHGAGRSRLKNEKLAGYRQSLSQSTAYAGHLSSMVFGKIKSLWSAQASTFNLGLNQFAGRTFIILWPPCAVFVVDRHVVVEWLCLFRSLLRVWNVFGRNTFLIDVNLFFTLRHISRV